MITKQLRLPQLKPHASNARPKRAYSKADLKDLVSSIREHGLLQPLVVTKNGDGYTMLAGHRRHAALKVLKAKEAPCIVLDAQEDEQALARSCSPRTPSTRPWIP